MADVFDGEEEWKHIFDRQRLSAYVHSRMYLALPAFANLNFVQLTSAIADEMVRRRITDRPVISLVRTP